jgi:hypothetical protein
MLGHQLMMCDINQQVLLDEALDPRLRCNSRDDLERSWGNANTRDEDTSVKVASRNSTQIVPISGEAGLGSLAVTGLEYLFIMASLGRAEKLIPLRLDNAYVSRY